MPQAGVAHTMEIASPSVLEAGSPRSRCQYGWVLVWTLSRVADSTFLLRPHMVESREEEASSRNSHKGTNPIHEGFTLMTKGSNS